MTQLVNAAHYYRPKILVYGFTSNDIEDRSYRNLPREGARRAVIQRSRRFRDSPSALLRAVWPRLMSLREWLWPTPGSYQVELHHNYFENDAAWSDFLQALDRLADLADSGDWCAVVFLHTSLTELSIIHPELDIYERVADAARERGLPVIESFPHFRGRSASALWVYLNDPHPNAEGNAILAQALHEAAKSPGLSSTGPEVTRILTPISLATI